MADISTLTFESPFEPGTDCKAVRETQDGKGVHFHCPASGRDFVVSYEALAEINQKASQPAPKKEARG
jgi:hypothetical protein